MNELISKREALYVINDAYCCFEMAKNRPVTEGEQTLYKNIIAAVKLLLPTEAILYGYNIRHLILIAEVLKKENLPPERVAEILTDIDRIVAIVKDDFEETLKKGFII